MFISYGGIKMLRFSRTTNTLIHTNFKYSLQEVRDPNLYREIYSYDEIPKSAL